MPLFIQIFVYVAIVWILSQPFLNLIDEYHEMKEAEEKEKEYLAQDDDFDWDWLEEVIREEYER